MSQYNNNKNPFRNKANITQVEKQPVISSINNITTNNYEQTKVSEFANIHEFLCLSSEHIPNTQYLIKNSGIPFGIHFNPFINGINDMKTISIGNSKIPSCIKCGAFINKYCEVDDNSKWKCNICLSKNASLKSLDNLIKEQAVTEVFACSDYIERSPIEPSIVFIIDVSRKSIESGFLQIILDSIRHIFNNKTFQDEERTNVAFITYDSKINFFELNKKNGNMQILTINGDEPYLPQKETSLLIPFDEYRNQLDSFIDTFQSIYSIHRVNESTIKESNKVTFAIEAGLLLLQRIGGKLIVLNTSMSWLKESNSSYSQTQKTTYDYLKNLGQQLTKHQIAIEIFQTQQGKEIQNATSLNTICDYANGYFYLFNSFRPEIHYNSLFHQLTKSITKEVATEILMSINHSSEVTIKTLTPVPIQSSNTIIFPQMDRYNSYCFLFNYLQLETKDQSTNEVSFPLSNNPINFQFTIIYTHSDCSRRIRIFNIQIPKCNSNENYYCSINIEASISLIAKIFMHQVLNGNTLDYAVSEIQQIYFNYAFTSLKEFNCKELLEQFLLCYLGLMKNRISCKEIERNKINIDLVNNTRMKMLKAKIEEVMTLILPKIFNITSVIQGSNTFDNIFLNPCQCDISSIIKDNIYLIDNGQFLILYFTEGQQNNELIKIFFGDGLTFDIVGTRFHSEQTVFEENEYKSNAFIQRTLSAITSLRERKCYYQELFFSFEGSLSECM